MVNQITRENVHRWIQTGLSVLTLAVLITGGILGYFLNTRYIKEMNVSNTKLNEANAKLTQLQTKVTELELTTKAQIDELKVTEKRTAIGLEVIHTVESITPNIKVTKIDLSPKGNKIIIDYFLENEGIYSVSLENIKVECDFRNSAGSRTVVIEHTPPLSEYYKKITPGDAVPRRTTVRFSDSPKKMLKGGKIILSFKVRDDILKLASSMLENAMGQSIDENFGKCERLIYFETANKNIFGSHK